MRFILATFKISIRSSALYHILRFSSALALIKEGIDNSGSRLRILRFEGLDVYQFFIMGHTEAYKRIIDFADKDFVSLDVNTVVAEAARIMYERDVNSVIVTHNRVKC